MKGATISLIIYMLAIKLNDKRFYSNDTVRPSGGEKRSWVDANGERINGTEGVELFGSPHNRLEMGQLQEPRKPRKVTSTTITMNTYSLLYSASDIQLVLYKQIREIKEADTPHALLWIPAHVHCLPLQLETVEVSLKDTDWNTKQSWVH